MNEIKADILAVYFEGLSIISCTLLAYRDSVLLYSGWFEAMMPLA